jgi:hypothetical protein
MILAPGVFHSPFGRVVQFLTLSLWESRALRPGEGLPDGLFVLDKGANRK